MSCGGGIWGKRNGDSGACNQCPPTVAADGAWTCRANGDISFDIRGKNAKVCTSWSTEGSCEFKQKDLRALQATLQSSGCDGLWAAPLWIAPKSWAAPQHATGEIDVFERGCSTANGYLLSFGESDQYIVPEAWGENGKAGAATALTAYRVSDKSALQLVFRRDTRRSLRRFHRPAWSPAVKQFAAGRLFWSVTHRGCASLACWRRLGLCGPCESGGPPSLAGQRHVNGENVSCRDHVTVPEERLSELLLNAVAPKHSAHPCRQARLSASAQRRRMARLGLGLGPGARPRACGTLRLRLGRRLGALVGFLQELVAGGSSCRRDSS